jgi:hypothetical protein
MINSRLAVWLTLSFCLLLAIVDGIVAILLEANGSYDASVSAPDLLGQVVLALTFPLVGSLIAIRRPGNLIGWALLLAGIALMAETFLRGYGELALLAKPEADLPGGMVAAAIGMGAWTLLMASVFLLLLLFPGGKLPSRRWKLVAWLVLIAFGIIWVGIATSPTVDPPFQQFENPLAFSNNEDYSSAPWVLIGPCLVAVAAAAVNLLLRFWRSSGDEREQYKWLAFAGCFLIASLPPALVTSFETGIAGVIVFLALIALPISVGIAVLKYRLYDIDVIINRALVYVPLTAILAGLFVASTALVRTVFTDLTDTGSDMSVAASTIAIVALLTPLKNWLQALVDRHFKESPDPTRALKQLIGQGRTVVEVLDTQKYIERLVQEIAGSLGADGAALERRDARLYSFGGPAAGEALKLPLVHDGATVGALALWGRSPSRLSLAELPPAVSEATALLAHVLSLSSRKGRITPADALVAAE